MSVSSISSKEGSLDATSFLEEIESIAKSSETRFAFGLSLNEAVKPTDDKVKAVRAVYFRSYLEKGKDYEGSGVVNQTGSIIIDFHGKEINRNVKKEEKVPEELRGFLDSIHKINDAFFHYFTNKLEEKPEGVTENHLEQWVLDQMKRDFYALPVLPEEKSDVTTSQISSPDLPDMNLSIPDLVEKIKCQAKEGRIMFTLTYSQNDAKFPEEGDVYKSLIVRTYTDGGSRFKGPDTCTQDGSVVFSLSGEKRFAGPMNNDSLSETDELNLTGIHENLCHYFSSILKEKEPKEVLLKRICSDFSEIFIPSIPDPKPETSETPARSAVG